MSKRAVPLGIALAALVALGIWFEVTVWTECRQTNSWLYCVRMLGR